MNTALLRKVLDGDHDAAMQFGECDHCAVVDWKDGIAEIVESVSDFLPPGYLRIDEEQSGEALLVRSDGHSFRAPVEGVKQEQLLVAVNQALLPDYEMRRFRPMDGDGYSLLVAPTHFWLDLERNHKEAAERYFLSVERLATHKRKGFLARLFDRR